ncbi:MAG: rod shape-determining protein MreC [Gammaproteobacteria bacterium]|nr:rod shape-determining protein MreC [Gammaproteobacteria bacterium]MBU1725522.1 rod shape-determining protein MreC [Gammaproteobacteria bacterium]MBU2007380.1 rod shape-determining protein MreC [Gammaproteobacteria bacterium]
MALVLSALMLMAVDYRNPDALRPVRTAALMLVYPLLVSVDSPHRFYNRTAGFFSSQTTLAMENAALTKKVETLSAQQRILGAVQQENAHLRSMLNAAPHDDYTFTLAETLEAANDRVRGLVVLNKGSRDGVHESQVVLAGENVYGQVIEVTPFSSKVIQLVDRNHTIPVRNQRTGERALANGMGRGQALELRNLPGNSDVKEGDLFVSSGLGGLFPPNFPVAKVAPQGVEFKQGAPFATVKAIPLVNYETTRDVLLIWRKEGVPAPVVDISQEPAPAEATTEAEAKNTDAKPAKASKQEGSR